MLSNNLRSTVKSCLTVSTILLLPCATPSLGSFQLMFSGKSLKQQLRLQVHSNSQVKLRQSQPTQDEQSRVADLLHDLSGLSRTRRVAPSTSKHALDAEQQMLSVALPT